MTLAAQIRSSAFALLEGAKEKDRLLRDAFDESAPGEAWNAALAAGWRETIVPEEKGGLGLGLAELGAIFRAVGARLCRGPVMDALVVGPLAGVDEAAYAEPLAPPYGGALAHGRGTVSGGVDLVRFPTLAKRFVAVAPGAILVVEATDARVDPLPSNDPSVSYGRLRFDKAPARVIASGSEADALRERMHATMRLMAAAEVAGACSEMVAMALEYAKVRQQFGRPIAGFQAVRHLLAAMATRARSLENLVDATLADADADADPARLAQLGRVAKAYSSQVGRSVAEDALQAHGGIGFTAEYPLHLYMRRVLTYEGFLGETTDLLLSVGERALAG